MMEAAIEEFPQIPIVMHQDHGGSNDDCKICIDLGFSSVMRDGSLLEDQKTPSDFYFNVKVTKETVEIAHAHGVSVEGELGCLGSLETGMGEQEDGVGAEEVLSHDQLLTDPDEAAEFVRETQVDALAIAIGTSHGAYKFTRPPTGDTLAIDRIKEIANKHKIFLLEDCALTLESRFRKIKVGNYGDASLFSFDHTKPLNGFSGGAIYTKQKLLYEKYSSIKTKIQS